jgi:hypothetical protein
MVTGEQTPLSASSVQADMDRIATVLLDPTELVDSLAAVVVQLFGLVQVPARRALGLLAKAALEIGTVELRQLLVGQALHDRVGERLAQVTVERAVLLVGPVGQHIRPGVRRHERTDDEL